MTRLDRIMLAAMVLSGGLQLGATTIDPTQVWGSGPDQFTWQFSADYGWQPISTANGLLINRIDFGENVIPPVDDYAPLAVTPTRVEEIPVPQETQVPEPGTGTGTLIPMAAAWAAVLRDTRRRREQRARRAEYPGLIGGLLIALAMAASVWLWLGGSF